MAGNGGGTIKYKVMLAGWERGSGGRSADDVSTDLVPVISTLAMITVNTNNNIVYLCFRIIM